MHAKTQSSLADRGQRNVIAGQINSLETVHFLEMAQTVALFFPVREVFIHEKRDFVFCTGTHRLRDQRIGWSLVLMLHHGEDMHQAGLIAAFIHDQLDEADHGVTDESSDINTTVEKCTSIISGLLWSHSVIRKGLALANRGFVINSADSFN